MQTMKVHPDNPSLAATSNSGAKMMESDQFTSAVTSPCEDIWSKFDDFLLTPPQSPPVELESLFTIDTSTDDLLNLALDDFLEETNCLSDSSLVEVIDSFQHDVLNDCMWSGPSLEEFANMSDPSVGVKNSRRNDTQVLGTSPLVMSFGEMLTCDEVEMDDDDDDDVPTLQDDASSSSCVESTSSGFVSGSESLIDHSYGSPKCTMKSCPPSTSAQSLIFPPPDYKKVITKSKKRAQRASAVRAPPVTVKFVKPPVTSNMVGGVRKPVKQCKSARVKQQQEAMKKASSLETGLIPSPSPSTSSCGSRSSKVIGPEKRKDHNVSERKRRDLLRGAFHCLRDQVPKLREGDKKPARIVILHEATSYVQTLVDKQRYLEKAKEGEMKKREKLLQKLASLKH